MAIFVGDDPINERLKAQPEADEEKGGLAKAWNEIPAFRYAAIASVIAVIGCGVMFIVMPSGGPSTPAPKAAAPQASQPTPSPAAGLPKVHVPQQPAAPTVTSSAPAPVAGVPAGSWMQNAPATSAGQMLPVPNSAIAGGPPPSVAGAVKDKPVKSATGLVGTGSYEEQTRKNGPAMSLDQFKKALEN